MHDIRFQLGFCPTPLTEFKGPTSKEVDGRKDGREG